MTKPKKLTSYQKLKAKTEEEKSRNTSLQQDIYHILRGNFTNKSMATTKWNHIFDQEEIIWHGDTSYTITN